MLDCHRQGQPTSASPIPVRLLRAAWQGLGDARRSQRNKALHQTLGLVVPAPPDLSGKNAHGSPPVVHQRSRRAGHPADGPAFLEMLMMWIESVSQSVGRSVGQSVSQSVSQSVGQSVSQSVSQPACQSAALRAQAQCET